MLTFLLYSTKFWKPIHWFIYDHVIIITVVILMMAMPIIVYKLHFHSFFSILFTFYSISVSLILVNPILLFYLPLLKFLFNLFVHYIRLLFTSFSVCVDFHWLHFTCQNSVLPPPPYYPCFFLFVCLTFAFLVFWVFIYFHYTEVISQALSLPLSTSSNLSFLVWWGRKGAEMIKKTGKRRRERKKEK